MVDLHSHILPGLDDGSKAWQESLDMARMAVEDGIFAVVCTPHWVSCQYENDSNLILKSVKKFQTLLADKNIPLKIHPGAELRLDPCLPSLLKSGSLLTLNDNKRYALVELPMHVLPTGIQSFFFELVSHGITPVIAHPERYPWIIESPSIVYQWVNDGFLVQLTAASLLGHFGRTIRRLSTDLLEHNLVHILATDSHGLHLRSPKLSRARQAASDIVGEELSWNLVRKNPAAIVAGGHLNLPEPIAFRHKQRSGWLRFFSFGPKRPPTH